MHEDLKTNFEEIGLVLKEIDRYKDFKKQLLSDLKSLNKQYESEIIDYKTYTKLKEKLLEGKTKEEQIEYFNAYILFLVKKVEYLNTQVFSLIYNYQPEKDIVKKISERKREPASTLDKKTQKPLQANVEIIENVQNEGWILQKTKAEELKRKKQIREIDADIALEDAKVIIQKKTDTIETRIQAGQRPAALEIKEEIEKAEEITSKSKKYEKPKALGKADELSLKEKEVNVQDIGYEYGLTPKPFPRKSHAVPLPRKKSLKSLAKSAFAKVNKNDIISRDNEKELGFRAIFNFGFLKELIRRMRDKEKLISKDTIREKSLLDFQGMAEVDFETEARTNPNLLIKQASQLKALLKKRKIKIYSPSVIGTLANISVRRLSIFFIDSFPDFFKKFYLTLRYANIKVLSNTYVNIMVFLSFLSAMIFGILTMIYGAAMQNPVFLIISKTFLMAALGIVLCAGFMIYYPYMKIESRIKSINTNLPFAIDHMSSIVASGVPPSSMFRLLAESKEYGEVSLEIEKASNFIDVFGYDLLTAIRSVSSTTPSPPLKEFFEGLISTIETGGSLKNYLSQKSQESMLSYKIERQKYVETIATYSDIYTGVLIAAPLFFVSALSLVSILGGKIGGFEVETLIAFGTYIVIPLMNIGFIIFLEFNQPDI